MKKKIFCVLFAVVFVLMAFPFTASAETAEDEVLEDLKNMVIDGVPFDLKDYPFNANSSEWQFLGAKELGVKIDTENDDRPFLPYGANEHMYLYFYDASCHSLDRLCACYLYGGDLESSDYEEWLNSVRPRQIFESIERSADGRFLRCKVQPWGIQLRDSEEYYYYVNREREYSLTCLMFADYEGGGYHNWENVLVRETFVFSGSEDNGTLQCLSGDHSLLTLKLHSTVWRDENPTSSSSPNTFNQLATVYFTVPDYVYHQYDRLYSIDADFKRLHSTPMIVTASSSLNDFEDINLLCAGVEHLYWVGGHAGGRAGFQYGYENFDTLPQFMTKLSDSGNWWWHHNIVHGVRHQYSGWVYNCQDFDARVYLEQGHGDCICNLVGWYFYNPNIQIDENNMFYQAVSSAYMEAYVNAVSNLYSEAVDEETGIASFLYDSCEGFPGVHYLWTDTWNLQSTEFNQNYKWWLGLFDKSKKDWKYRFNEEEIPAIVSIEDPASVAVQYANDLNGLSDAYKIGKADAAKFLNYLQNANGVVVLLRFDLTTYEMHPVDAVMYEGGQGNVYNRVDYDEEKTWMCQQYFYHDVDVTRVCFEKDSKIYTYTVKADPINVYGGVDVKETPHVEYASLIDTIKSSLPDFSQMFSQALKYLRIALLVLLVIVLLVIVGKFAGFFRFLRLRHMMRKQRRQERTKRKRD